MTEAQQKTRFDLFEDWSNGIGLLDGTKDHHALDAIRRFKLYEAYQLRKQATKKERD